MKRKSLVVMFISLTALMAGTAFADNTVPASVLVTSMIGAKAISADGQMLGTIADLVAGKETQPSYVLVSEAGNTGLAALSLEAASPQVDPHGNVHLAATRMDFDLALRYAGNQLSNLTQPDANAWKASDFIRVNGIATLNPYSF